MICIPGSTSCTTVPQCIWFLLTIYVRINSFINCCSLCVRSIMQEPVFLDKLEKGRHSHAIVVRVVRKWIHYENNGQGPPQYIGMVVADAKVLVLVLYKINQYYLCVKHSNHIFTIIRNSSSYTLTCNLISLVPTMTGKCHIC